MITSDCCSGGDWDEQSIGNNERRNENGPTEGFLTARAIVANLAEYIIGQDRAKRALACSVVRHFLGVANRDQGGTDFGRQTILLVGPSGSGKTYLLTMLAKQLSIPFLRVDCSKLVADGFVGDSAGSIFSDLKARFGEMPGGAIVFLDEIDKRRMERCSHRDITGRDVQASLLAILDGHVASFQRSSQDERHTIDTRRLLFVAGGAFVGLADIVRRRLSGNTFGFHAANDGELTDDEALARIEAGDIVEYGFMPEFVNRFSSITSTHSLAARDLVRILTQAQNTALTKQVAFFAAHGVTLEVTPEALRKIAQAAQRNGKGARGLQTNITEATAQIEYELPELVSKGLQNVRVTAECVSGEESPVCIFSSSSDRKSHSASQLSQLVAKQCNAQVPDPLSGTSVRDQIERIKEKDLDWENATGSARKWWIAFETENGHRPGLVLKLAQELAARDASITEFFLAYVYSNTDNIMANLLYLDYTRLKKREEAKKKKEAAAARAKAKKDETARPEGVGNGGTQGEKHGDALASESELVFVRCPACRSLLPKSESNRCKMCGENLMDEQLALPSDGSLVGIGYQGLSIEAFLKVLTAQGVRHVADIRGWPYCRRAPYYFNKNRLEETLRENGIEYTWLGDTLGNPKDEAGKRSLDGFKQFMRTDAYSHGLEALTGIIESCDGGVVALLCVERRQCECHRQLIMADIRSRTDRNGLR